MNKKNLIIGLAALALICGVGYVGAQVSTTYVAGTPTNTVMGNTTFTGTAAFSSTSSFTGAMSPTGGVTPNSPYTVFTTLQIPFNLVAPGSTTDTIAEYYSQLFIPQNATLTGLCYLSKVGTTDTKSVILWNSAGTIVAHGSTSAGVADVAATTVCQAFTTPYAAVGPASYFAGFQTNGTTDTFYTYTTGGAPSTYATGIQAAGVFGTFVNIATPATTFTTAQGPLMTTY